MVFIPQRHVDPYFTAYYALTFLLVVASGAGCAFSDTDPDTAARQIGESELPDRDLELTITSGAFRTSDNDYVEVRTAAPVARLRVQAGPDAEGELLLRATNVHREAIVEVVAVEFPSAEDIEGCSEISRAPIPCAEARAAIGDPCGVSTDCPAGLTCLESSCQPASAFALCDAPSYERTTSLRTTVDVQLDLPACRVVKYDFKLPEALENTPLRIAAIGSTDSLDKLREALAAASDPTRPDFIVVLGENVESSDEAGVDDLERLLRNTGVPIVYVTGDAAVSPENGAYVLRKLGPHDHVFELKGVRFVTFFSAQRELGTRGFDRLETFLRQAERLGGGPLMAFTHTVPIDPNGVRNQGFKNRIEGARTMSLLKEFGVDYLFTGRINETDHEQVGDIDVWVTSAEDAILRKASSFLDIEVSDEENGDRTIDGFGVTVRSKDF